MRTLVAFFLLLLAWPSLGAEPSATDPTYPFLIEEYEFTWHVAKAGDVQLAVNRSHESTTIELSGDNDFLTLTAANAQEIGEVLVNTDTYWSKMKGSTEDRRETIPAGEYQITFWQSPKYGFNVSVGPADGFSLSRISLDRKVAKALAPHLRRAKQMVKFLNDRTDRIFSQ